MEDSLATVKMYETARVEYDAYRTDLEFYKEARDTEINQMRLAETQVRFNEKKLEFEKLRSDVQIKLKFLDDNRVIKQCRSIIVQCLYSSGEGHGQAASSVPHRSLGLLFW